MQTHVYPLAQGTAPRSENQSPGAFSLSGSHEHPWHPSHLRSLLHDGDALAGGKWKLCPRSRTRCCRVKKVTCSHSMSFGASCRPRRKLSGSGWLFADARARSSPGRGVTAACKVPAICGPLCLQGTDVAPPAATSGRRAEPPSPPERTAAAARRRAKPATSNAGCARCANVSAAWSAKLCLSPNTLRTTSMPSTSSSPATTSPSSNQHLTKHHPAPIVVHRRLLGPSDHGLFGYKQMRSRCQFARGNRIRLPQSHWGLFTVHLLSYGVASSLQDG